MSFGKLKDTKSTEPALSASVHQFIPGGTSTASSSSRAEAFLGQGTTIRGTVNFEGQAQVDGSIEGEINAGELLTIGQTAVVKATVKGSEIVILGNLQGDVFAAKKLTLKKPARVTGNISSPIIAIEEGVEFEGSCSMKGAVKK